MAAKHYTSESIKPTSPDEWYWCLHCNRAFQARSLRAAFRGEREGCAFCDAAGLGVDVWPWNAFRKRCWPRSTSRLRHGLVLR